jgi:hypothetical protein
MKRKGLMKKLKGIISLVTLLIMTVSSLGVPAQVFAADSKVPANLTAKHDDTQKWTVIQFDKVDNAESYNIYRSESQDGEFKRVQTLKSDKTFTADNYMDLKTSGTLKADYLYYYKVSAVVDGKEQVAIAPIANQEVVTQSSESKMEEEAPTAATTEETAQESSDVQAYGAAKHNTGCATTMRGNMMSIVTKTIVNIVSVIPTNGSMTRTVIKSTAAKTAIKIIASMTNIAIKITMAEVVMTINGAINQPAMKSTVGITAITIGNTMKIAIRNIAEKIVIKTTTKKNGMQLRMFV